MNAQHPRQSAAIREHQIEEADSLTSRTNSRPKVWLDASGPAQLLDAFKLTNEAGLTVGVQCGIEG